MITFVSDKMNEILFLFVIVAYSIVRTLAISEAEFTQQALCFSVVVLSVVTDHPWQQQYHLGTNWKCSLAPHAGPTALGIPGARPRNQPSGKSAAIRAREGCS